MSHAAVAKALVVAIPDDITDESVYAFVTTKVNVAQTDGLKKELIQQVADMCKIQSDTMGCCVT